MITFENFILQYDNLFSAYECQQFIDSFNRMDRAGFTISRQKQDPNTNSSIKKDDQFYSSDVISGMELDITDMTPCRMFNEKFWNVVFPAYTEEYGVLLDNHSRMTIRSMKLQKTEVGGGYHIWHCEDATPEQMRRVMTFILYLNDVDEGGETEFLYYPKRVKSKQGRLILWPAGYTHTHRGNPPLSNTKYVLTGWVELS
jgi:hypothetical protein